MAPEKHPRDMTAAEYQAARAQLLLDSNAAETARTAARNWARIVARHETMKGQNT